MPRFLFILLVFVTFQTCTPSYNSRIKANGIVLRADTDFESVVRGDYVPAYLHKDTKALAVNAAKYKDRFALAETKFAGPAGKYRLELSTLRELDGDSEYRVYVDDKLMATVKNDPTDVDYAPQLHQLGRVRVQPGAVIGVAFSSSSNGKIPENGGFAFSRGRWTELRLRP